MYAHRYLKTKSDTHTHLQTHIHAHTYTPTRARKPCYTNADYVKVAPELFILNETHRLHYNCKNKHFCQWRRRLRWWWRRWGWCNEWI